MAAGQRKCGGRLDGEHQQATIRVCIAFIVTGVYLLLFVAWGGFTVWDDDAPVSLEVARFWVGLCVGYFACALALRRHVLNVPVVRPWCRRVTGLTLDLVTLSIGLAAGGPLTAPLFVFYPWVEVGNGMRFGIRYLFAAMALSVVGFTVVIMTSSYWGDHLVLSISLLGLLVAVPGYLAALLVANPARSAGSGSPKGEHPIPDEVARDRRPPLLAEKLLHFLLTPDIADGIVGDLNEAWGDHYDEFGRLYARLWYWKQAAAAILRHTKHIRWIAVGALGALGGLFQWVAEWLLR